MSLEVHPLPMRLRVVRLPESANRAPYLLVLDRTPADFFGGDENGVQIRNLGDQVKEASVGLCHGFLVVEGELEIQ